MAWSEEGAKRLDQILRSQRIRGIDVAGKLGVDQGQVSRWRHGKQVPNADQLAKILGMAKGPGLADYVLGLTALNPLEVQRLRADVARLLSVADRDEEKRQ